MVAALPGNIRLKLEQTLAQWRQWSCEPALPRAPRVMAVLTEGLSNFSVLVEAGQRFVVRIDGVNPAVHSLNRQGEWHSLAAAHRAGLAPGPRYFNPELGSLVCDYLAPDENQPQAIADIAKLMHGIHQLPARHHRLDLPERIHGYENRLAHRNSTQATELKPYRPIVMQLLAETTAAQHAQVLCHHDLLRANRIYSGGKLYALDWEYSAMGDPWYDLAVIIAGDSLLPAEAATLLRVYLGRPASAPEQHRVTQYCCIYRYLELLWYLAQNHPGLDKALLDHRLWLLASSLQQVSQDP